jgi:Skp family chaperone for outer membrane proteins
MMNTNARTLLAGAATNVVCLAFSGTNRAAQDSKPASSLNLDPAPRVAVVDIVKVFDTCEQTVVLNRKLADFTRQFMDRLEAQSKAAQAEQDALTAFAVGTAEYYQQQKKAKKMALENEVGSQLERDAMAENHKRWLLETYKMITAEITKAAKAHDVDIVLTREQLNSTDVTD